MEVTTYSHNYAIRGYNRYGYDFLKRFARIHFGEVDQRAIRMNRMPSRFRKKPIPTISKTYASCTNDGREFRFHINTLALFKEAVSNDNTLKDQLVIKEEELYTPAKVGLKVLEHWVPREDQVGFIDYFKAPGKTKVLTIPPGGGKALRHGSKVLTAKGWVNIENIKIGDWVVTPNRSIGRVLGVYPQGMVRQYRVSFDDGRYSDCCLDHLWGIQRGDGVRVFRTEEIIAGLKDGVSYRLPKVTPWAGVSSPSPVDPYVFGLLYTNSRKMDYVKKGMLLRLDEAAKNKLEMYAPFYGCSLEPVDCKHHRTSNFMFRHRGNHDLSHYTSYESTVGLYDFRERIEPIPREYLDNTVEKRMALLSGLLEGLRLRGKTYEPNGWRIRDTQLSEDIIYLARSLGYVAYTLWASELRLSVTYILFQEQSEPRITSVIPRPIKDYATCIAIDHPSHMFITNNFIPTHNTYCSLESTAAHNERLCVCIESKFFHLWEEALSPKSDKQVLDLTEDEVLWVQGGKDLKALLNLALNDGLDGIKVIVVALRTFANYIETYNRWQEGMLDLYPVLPIDFHRALDVGTIIKDEVHLSLYANFMEELFTHAPRRFSLSGTLEDGSFKDTVFGIMFPMEERFQAAPPKKYIDVTALKYRLREPSRVECSNRGSSDYNHNAYEKWILKDRKRLNNYMKIMLEWLTKRFLNVFYFEGQKAVIFVTSTQMVTEVYNFLSKNVPHYTFGRYAASTGDDYELAKEADILITTDKSFSTGFDLPGLVCALLTVAINSPNTNIQILGRLRELRNHPNITPIFDYLVCEDIPRHVDYHEEKRRKIFVDRVKSHKVKYIGTVV